MNPRRRRGLAFQIGLVTTSVALLSVILAVTVSTVLIRAAITADAHTKLARDADLVASLTLTTRRPAGIRPRRLVRAAGIRVDLVDPTGRVSGPLPLSAADVTTLLAGKDLSEQRALDGRNTVLEGRPLAGGGAVVLAAGARLSGTIAHKVRVAELLALLSGLAGGALAGLVLARRLARPLSAVAAAAHQLAAGGRDVDISPEGPAEVVEVSEAINRLGIALRSSEQRQREFLLSVSHELRTPLTAIRGFSEALADGVTAGADVRPTGVTMLAEAERLDRLVADLLDLARLGAHDFPLSLVDVDLHALLGSADAVWRHRCAVVAVRWQLDRPTEHVMLHTDPVRVRQMIDGLLDNALRVTPSGAPIVLSLRAEPSVAVLEVRDGGPGLRDDDLAVAFDGSVLYERYRGVRQVGTGLGLALVARLAGRLGGSVSASHAPEGGACFTIRLPDPRPAERLQHS